MSDENEKRKEFGNEKSEEETSDGNDDEKPKTKPPSRPKETEKGPTTEETGKTKGFFGGLLNRFSNLPFVRNKFSEQGPETKENAVKSDMEDLKAKNEESSDLPINNEASSDIPNLPINNEAEEKTDLQESKDEEAEEKKDSLVKQEIKLKDEEAEEPRKKRSKKHKHKHKKAKEKRQQIQFDQPTSEEEANKELTEEEIFKQKVKKFDEMYKLERRSTSKLKTRTPPKLTFHDHYITKKFEMMKRRQRKRHEAKTSYVQTKKTALWILFVFLEAISESSTWIFVFTSESFRTDELEMENEDDSLIRNSVQGTFIIITAYIADSYLKRFLTVIYFNFVTLVSYFGLALLLSIKDYLNNTLKWIFLATAYAMNVIGSSTFAAHIFLVLDQTQTLKQIRKSCVLSIWLKHLFLLILEVSIMIFYKEKKFPLMLSFIGVSSQIVLISVMIILAPRVQSHHFEKYSVESLFFRTCIYSKLKRKKQMEEIQETKQFYKVFYTLSPFIIYFLLAKFIEIPWTTTHLGYTDIEKQLTRSSMALLVHGISVITIPVLEWIIFPFFGKTKFDDLKYFGIGVIFLGISFILSFIVFIHMENSYAGPPKPKTANLLIINGMERTVQLKGEFTKGTYVSVKPLTAYPIPMIPVSDAQVTDRLSVEVKEKKIKYWKRVFLDEQQTTIFVVSKGYRLIRVRGFESALTQNESYFHLSKVVFYTTHMINDLNITFHLLETDENVVTDRKRSIINKKKEQLLAELSKSEVKIPTPTYGDQSSIPLEPGRYQIKGNNLTISEENVTLKSRQLHHFLIHGLNGTITEIKTKDSTRISSFWDTPTIFFHTLSYNTIIVSYLCYIYLNSPENLKTFSLAILSFDRHLIPFILQMFLATQFTITTQIYVFGIILYMLDLVLFIFITIKYRILLYLKK